MNTTVYSTSSVIDLLLGSTLYTDMSLETPFTSIGTDGYYAVSTTSGANTFIVGNTNYKLLEINTSGLVENVLINVCECDVDGGTPL
jgi:hypothetical protein